MSSYKLSLMGEWLWCKWHSREEESYALFNVLILMLLSLRTLTLSFGKGSLHLVFIWTAYQNLYSSFPSASTECRFWAVLGLLKLIVLLIAIFLILPFQFFIRLLEDSQEYSPPFVPTHLSKLPSFYYLSAPRFYLFWKGKGCSCQNFQKDLFKIHISSSPSPPSFENSAKCYLFHCSIVSLLFFFHFLKGTLKPFPQYLSENLRPITFFQQKHFS